MSLLQNNLETITRERALQKINDVYGWDEEFLKAAGFERLVDTHPENVETKDLASIACCMEFSEIVLKYSHEIKDRLQEKWGLS